MPSVTQVCCMHVDTKWIPKESAVRGTAVHQWVNNSLRSIWDPFNEETYPEYVFGFKTWIDENKPTLLIGEVNLRNNKLDLTGHPDFIGTVEGIEGVGIVDFKTSQARQPWWKLQLAGYNLLAKGEEVSKVVEKIDWCASLRVDKEGRSAFDMYSVEEIESGYEEKFLNLLGLYVFLKTGKKHNKSIDKFIKMYHSVSKEVESSAKAIANYIRFDSTHKKSLFN